MSSREYELVPGKLIWSDAQGNPIILEYMAPTQEALDIIDRIFPEWLDLFLKKNRQYGNNPDDLGVRGDYADMHRKWKVLRRGMWDFTPLPGESTREVLLDMIGHCFRAIHHGDTRGWAEDASLDQKD